MQRSLVAVVEDVVVAVEGEVRVWRRVVDAEVVAVDVRVELVEGLEEGRGSGYSCR